MSAEIVTISTPQWLEKTFLEKHLRKYYQNGELHVLMFDVKPAVAKGESYFSCIHRVNVMFTLSKNDSIEKGDVSGDVL